MSGPPPEGWHGDGSGMVQSIVAGSSATANGTALDNGAARVAHSMVVTGVGTSTAGSVVLELSHDNANWFVVGTVSPTAAGTYAVQVTGWPARFTRARISVAMTGGTVGATVMSS